MVISFPAFPPFPPFPPFCLSAFLAPRNCESNFLLVRHSFSEGGSPLIAAQSGVPNTPWLSPFLPFCLFYLSALLAPRNCENKFYFVRIAFAKATASKAKA
jgi:hypothetical protein